MLRHAMHVLSKYSLSGDELSIALVAQQQSREAYECFLRCLVNPPNLCDGVQPDYRVHIEYLRIMSSPMIPYEADIAQSLAQLT